MTVAVVLDRLRQSGWSVEVLEGHLSLEPTRPDVPEMIDEQRQFLAKHKAAIIDALALKGDATDKRDAYEERAAIMEYDGKLTRQEAERKAVGNNRYVHARIVRCHTCLRYGPKDRYCGHKLRHIQADEREICAGRGYSPKGSPWKELRS